VRYIGAFAQENHVRLSTRTLLCCCLLAGFALHAPLRAQDRPANYPVRPIRIIVPVVPGGGLDIIARSIGQMLNDRLIRRLIR